MEEIITVNGQQFNLESSVSLTEEQRNEVIKQLGKISTIGTSTNCPNTSIKTGTSKEFQSTASGGNGSYNYELTIGSTVYNSPIGSGATWNQIHTFNTAGTITPVSLKVVDTCTGTTLYDTSTCALGITVENPILNTVQINDPNNCSSTIGTVTPNDKCQLSATCYNQFGELMTCPTLFWSSDNTTVASVNLYSGLVTGKLAGTATIKALAESIIYGTKVVTVVTSCTQPSCGFTIANVI